MRLLLKNNVDKKEYEFSVTDLEDSGMFYHFDSISLPNGIVDGEYNYYLYDENDKLVAEGLVQVGNYEIREEEKHTYNNNNTEYIQYMG